jgi:hypothetical protein
MHACSEAPQHSPIRVLQSIVSAVPVRLMKRDLLFIAEQLLPLLDEAIGDGGEE